jgi:hypothetical protein
MEDGRDCKMDFVISARVAGAARRFEGARERTPSAKLRFFPQISPMYADGAEERRIDLLLPPWTSASICVICGRLPQGQRPRGNEAYLWARETIAPISNEANPRRRQPLLGLLGSRHAGLDFARIICTAIIIGYHA